MKNLTWAFQLSALKSYRLIKVLLKLHKSVQIWLWTWAHFSQNLFVPEGLTVVQQSAFPSMHWGLVTERQPGPHVTRQNKTLPAPPTLSALALSLSLSHTHTHTHCLLSRLKFICCIQMPASNYTSTCSERVSEQGRGGREGGKGEVTMGAFDTVAIARPTLCLDPSWKRSDRACLFFLSLFILLFFFLSVLCSLVLGSGRLKV